MAKITRKQREHQQSASAQQKSSSFKDIFGENIPKMRFVGSARPRKSNRLFTAMQVKNNPEQAAMIIKEWLKDRHK